MRANNCPLCKARAQAIQPIRGRGHQWNVGCDSCGLVLFGDEGESRKSQVAEWNRLGATPEHELLIRETKTGFIAHCRCGQKIHRASGCRGSGYWYGREAADETFADHLAAVAKAAELAAGGDFRNGPNDA